MIEVLFSCEMLGGGLGMADRKNDTPAHPRHIVWSGEEGKAAKGMPWGPHKASFNIDLPGVSIKLEKRDHYLQYSRSGAGGKVEKSILTENGEMLIRPAEPSHLNKAISSSLLIEFEQAVVLKPGSSREFMVTFPLELVSVFTSGRKGGSIIDIFTLASHKFTLYGSVKDGLICKYWKSAVHPEIPQVNPLLEGVMVINAQNPGSNWVEIGRAVFSVYGMKIFYSPELVSLNTTMKIINEFSAETGMLDKPFKKGMKKVPEQFNVKLLGQQGRFIMEEGF